MSVLSRLIDRFFGGTFVTTDQPDPELRCPNCKESLIRWTESAWDQGVFHTRYWQGCPNYRFADHKDEHVGRWRRTSWGSRTVWKRK